MSIEAMKWAMDEGEKRGLETPQRFLLLLLGSVADERGGRLFPSHGYLAERTGMSRATVKRHMRSLEAIGMLTKEIRRREADGSQTSNYYQLAMAQPGLDLPGEQLPPPGQIDPGSKLTPGSQLRPPGRVTAVTPHEVKEEVKPLKPSPGAKAPTAVAECWKAYSQAMKSRYGVEPPASARSNGQLSQVVARIGAGPAARVAAYYVAAPEAFYAKTKHSIDYLLRDCVGLWMDLQKQTGGSSAPTPTATSSKVSLILEDGKALPLQEYPLGDHLDTARKAVREYAKMISLRHPKYVAVQQGAERRQFTIDEARA